MQRVTSQEAKQLIAQTEEAEARKANRQADREDRKRAREQKAKQSFREKLVAPILLIITVLFAALLVFLY